MNALGAALYTTLTGGTALITALGGTAIYYLRAPQGTTRPYVVFNQMSGNDANDSPRRARDFVYAVKAVANSLATAETVDDAVDDLLHMGTLTVTDWGCYWMARDNDIEPYIEDVGGGQTLWHAGGQYRIRLAE